MPVPGTKTAPKPKAKKSGPPARPVQYPRYETMICCNPRPDLSTGEVVEYDGPLTIEKAKEILGWETEDEYVRRVMTADPNQKESKLRAADFLLKDSKGNKVRCRNNTLNRPFDEKHSRKLAQDILTEGFMFNGEDIILGCTGLVLSGQHRLVGLVLAGEQWEAQGQCYQKYWDGVEPYLETLVFVGASEDPEVLKTYDNVKPRTLSDTIYTSPVFASLNASEKKRCSTILDQCIDWLWRRLDATSNRFVEHQTHSASLDFFDRHEKHMVAAVKHLHKLDGSGDGLGVSALGLNAGRSAGMLFLMGCSGTPDEKVERYHDLNSPKRESQLDWSNWDRALEFWSDIARGRETDELDENQNPVFRSPPWVDVLRSALSDLGTEGFEGRVTEPEKAAVVALAWYEYLNGNEDFGVEDVVPETAVVPASNRRYMVDDGPTFGGPDKGPGGHDDAEQPDDREAVRAARTERLKQIEAHNAAVIKADVEKKVVPNPTAKGRGSLNNGKGKQVNAEDTFPLHSDPERLLDDELAIEAGAAEELNRQTITNGKKNRTAARKAGAKK